MHKKKEKKEGGKILVRVPILKIGPEPNSNINGTAVIGR
jgi:hypothetical protein